MRPHHDTAPQPPATPPARVGVGLDTSRYGPYAAFLLDVLQPAATELAFAVSADGYAQLRQLLELIARRLLAVAFHVRLDAAGQYADNLLHFLHRLARHPETQTCALLNAIIFLSCGDH